MYGRRLSKRIRIPRRDGRPGDREREHPFRIRSGAEGGLSRAIRRLLLKEEGSVIMTTAFYDPPTERRNKEYIGNISGYLRLRRARCRGRGRSGHGRGDTSRPLGRPRRGSGHQPDDGRGAGLIEREGRRYRLGLKLFELGSRLAGRLPLCGTVTATGKVLVAFSPPDVARDMAGRELERVTPYTIVVPSVLLEQFDQIRRRGWGAEREECVLGWASVAAPVFGLGGALVGAISATLPSAGLIEESVATRVVATARAASRAIGRGLGPSSHGAGP